MTVAFAVLLGIVQGVTEFLPISSKTHLVVVPALLDHRPPSLAFIVLLHLGTLVALLVYFAADLRRLVVGIVRGGDDRRLAVLLIIASIPAAILGLLFEETFERLLSDPRSAAFALLATAVILLGAEWLSGGLSRRRERTMRTAPTTGDAVAIGFAQALALLPGVSRSGSTMGAGLALGLRRDAVARFSFLLAIPAIAGANAIEFGEVLDQGVGAPEIAGVIAAAVSGFLAVALLLRYLKRFTYLPFAAYCAAFAMLAGLSL